jgi:carbon monoxide dehydrogenase subunit G
MDLTHRFSVPAGVHKAWIAFSNVERLAPCFPGATITSVQGDEFTGKLKIKLGPSTLVYNGSGRYLERNKAERRVVIEASGKDKRRNGTAAVTVSASFTENGAQTDVEVLTNLEISGKPAHFGDEVIADVSEKLLDQFVYCMSDQFPGGLGTASEELRKGGVAAAAASGLDEAAVSGFDEADSEQTIELEPVPAAAEEASTGPVADFPPLAAETGFAAAARVADFTTPVAEPSLPRVSEPSRSTPPQGDAEQAELNALGTVVLVLLKRFGPALAVLGLLLFVAIKIIRRRS